MGATRLPRVKHLISVALLAVAIGLRPASGVGDNKGSWGSVIRLPLVPITAAVLPNYRLLMFSAYLKDGFGSTGSTVTATLNLQTGRIKSATIYHTNHDMFCPGTALLADGRLVVNGGSNALATSIYNPWTKTWAKGDEMNQGRAYNGDTLLMDGRVFTLGGSWSGGSGPKDAEVWSPVSKTWRKLPGIQAKEILTNDPEGVYRSDNHAWLFALGGGKVFHAGPSKKMHFFDTSGYGRSRFAGYRAGDPDAMNGCAVMYAPGRILTVGGATAYTSVPASRNAHVITLKGDTLTSVQKVESMKYPRAFHNCVVLPSGEVMVFGGQTTPVVFVDTGAVKIPEIWNPETGKWRQLAPSRVARTYHSVAVLLPNGKVFTGGGGACNKNFQSYCPGNTANHLDGEIFTPPYLLNPDGSKAKRPSIDRWPSVANPGSTINIKTNSPCAKFAIVRLGAATHSVNNDQRRVPLYFKSVGKNTYNLFIPPAASGVLPGYWLLFAMDARGVPSQGRCIRFAIVTPVPSFRMGVVDEPPRMPAGNSSGLPEGITLDEYQKD